MTIAPWKVHLLKINCSIVGEIVKNKLNPSTMSMKGKISLDNTFRFRDLNAYLKFYRKNKNRIQYYKIIPPQLGSRDFGYIEVKVSNSGKYARRPQF